MADLAKLAIVVDTKELVSAIQSLKDVPAAAQQAANGIDQLNNSVSSLESAFKFLAGAIAAIKLGEVVQDAILAAARYETLGVSMNSVGKNLGYTSVQLDSFTKSLQTQGISMLESRQTVLSMMQANMDLSKSTDLARVAQDAAVIANENSSQTLNRLVYAIQTAQPEILRTVGINVSFEQGYKRIAEQLGVTQESLDASQKMQSRFNQVMEAGANIAGTYDAAMGTAGKQITSFVRYIENLQVEFGKAFGPALTELILYATEVIKGLTEAVAAPLVQGILSSLASGLVTLVTNLDQLAIAAAAAGAVYAVLRIEMYAGSLAAAGYTLGTAALGVAMSGTLVAAGALSSAMSTLTAWLIANPYTALAAALAGLLVAYNAISASVADVKKQFDAHMGSLREATSAYAGAQAEVTRLENAYAAYQDAISRAGTNTYEQQRAVDALTQAFPELKVNVGSTAYQMDVLRASMEQAKQEMDRLAESARNKAVEEWGKQFDILLRAVDTANREIPTVWNSWKRLFGETSIEAGANVDELVAKLTKMRDEMAKQKPITDEQKQAWFDINIAIKEVQEKADSYTGSTKRLEQATRDAAAVVDDGTISINNMANAWKNLSSLGNSVVDFLYTTRSEIEKTMAVDTLSKGVAAAGAEYDATLKKIFKEAKGDVDKETAMISAALELYQSKVNAAAKKSGEERAKEADKAAKAEIAANKDSYTEQVRTINNLVAEYEKKYTAGQLSIDQMIELLGDEGAAYRKLANEFDGASSDMDKKSQEMLTKQEQYKEKKISIIADMRDAEIKAMDEGFAKTMAQYDLDEARDAESYEKKMVSLYGFGERSMAAMEAYYAWAESRRSKYVTEYKKSTDEYLQYEIDKIKQQMADGAVSYENGWSTINDKVRSKMEERQKLLDSEISLAKTQLQTNKENWDSMWDGIVNGGKTALDDILAHQKSWGTLSYQAWMDIYDAMKDYLQDSFVAVVKGDWGGLQDAFYSFCDAVLNAWAKMLADMVAQWAASGLASFLSGLSGGSLTFNVNNASAGGTAGTLGSLGSLASAGSTAYKVGSWLGEATGLSGLFGGGAAATYATGYGLYAGAGGALSESALAAEMAAWTTATEGATTAATAATTAASALSASMLAVTGGAGALIAVGGMVAGMLNASQDTSPEEARQIIADDISEIQRLQDVMDSNSDVAGVFSETVAELADEISKMGERAGYSDEQLTAMMGQLNSSAQATVQLGQAMAETDSWIDAQIGSLGEWLNQARSGQVTADGLAQKIEDVGSAFGITRDQALALADQLINGAISVDGFRAAMEQLASAAVVPFSQQIDALAYGLGLSASAASSLEAQVYALYNQFQAGQIGSEGLSLALEGLLDGLGITGAGTDDLITKLINLIETYNAIPSEISTDVVTYYSSVQEDGSVSGTQSGGGTTPNSNPIDTSGLYPGLSTLVSYGSAASYYHDGGWLTAHTGLWLPRLAPGEVPFIGLEDERVLSHQEIGNMGGPARVDALASGKTAAATVNVGGMTINISGVDDPEHLAKMLARPLKAELRRIASGTYGGH